MAESSPFGPQQVLENLQKAGTLNRKTVVHIIQDPELSRSSGESAVRRKCNDASLTSLEERILSLSDHTRITVESVNEFMLEGPTGARIVLSSLPLFLIPDQSLSNPSRRYSDSLVDSSKSDHKNGGWMQFSSSTPAIIEASKNTDFPSSIDSIIDPLPRLDDVFTDSPIDNVFNYLDPFTDLPKESINLEETTRDRTINDTFIEAIGGGGGGGGGGDERDLTDSDDNCIDDVVSTPFSVKYVEHFPSTQRAASVSFVTVVATSDATGKEEKRSIPATPTYLPPPPLVLFPRYDTKGGWLVKLSHRQGVFGDKWQKRYFILNGPVLTYFKKYGDSQPRGTIKLLPGSWCQQVIQGTPRMTDAVAKSAKAGIISVNRCLGVHRPNNFSASLSALLASEGAIDAFSSLTVALTNPSDSSRTFYMIASSEQERHSWIDAISHNIQAYARSQEALDTACRELHSMLQAVDCTVHDTLPSILLLLHLKRELVAGRQMDFL